MSCVDLPLLASWAKPGKFHKYPPHAKQVLVDDYTVWEADHDGRAKADQFKKENPRFNANGSIPKETSACGRNRSGCQGPRQGWELEILVSERYTVATGTWETFAPSKVFMKRPAQCCSVIPSTTIAEKLKKDWPAIRKSSSSTTFSHLKVCQEDNGR